MFATGVRDTDWVAFFLALTYRYCSGLGAENWENELVFGVKIGSCAVENYASAAIIIFKSVEDGYFEIAQRLEDILGCYFLRLDLAVVHELVAVWLNVYTQVIRDLTNMPSAFTVSEDKQVVCGFICQELIQVSHAEILSDITL